jgi:hypothetical protein
VVPLSLDPAFAPSHIANHSHIETRKQRVRSLQSACRIVVTCCDDRFHGRPCPMQSLNGFIEQSLCFAGWVLAIENISRHEQRVDFSLGNDSDQLVEYAGMLVLARISAQSLPYMPICGMQHANHCSIAPTLCRPIVLLAPPKPMQIL